MFLDFPDYNLNIANSHSVYNAEHAGFKLVDYSNCVQMDSQYYSFSAPDKLEILSVINKFRKNNKIMNIDDINIMLDGILDIEELTNENITPKLESFIGLFYFIEYVKIISANELINKIKFAIYLDDNGIFYIETDYTTKYLKAKFFDEYRVSYNICNNIDILNPNGALYDLIEDIEKKYA